MSINQTTKIIPSWQSQINRLANRKIAIDRNYKKAYKRKEEQYEKGITKCSQCEQNMMKYIADIQIENNRENAPICVACILGKKRKTI